MKRKAIRQKLISKPIIIAIAFFLQLTLLLSVVYQLSQYMFVLYVFFVLLSYVTVIIVLNRDDSPSYQLIWVIVILFIPLFGGFLYLLFGGKKIPKALQKEMMLMDSTQPYLVVDDSQLIKDMPESLERWKKLIHEYCK